MVVAKAGYMRNWRGLSTKALDGVREKKQYIIIKLYKKRHKKKQRKKERNSIFSDCSAICTTINSSLTMDECFDKDTIAFCNPKEES